MLLPDFGPRNRISGVIITLNLANIGKVAKIAFFSKFKMIFSDLS